MARDSGPVPATVARALLDDALVSVLVKEGDDIKAISTATRTIPARRAAPPRPATPPAASRAAPTTGSSSSTTSRRSKRRAAPRTTTAGASAPSTTTRRPIPVGTSSAPPTTGTSSHPTTTRIRPDGGDAYLAAMCASRSTTRSGRASWGACPVGNVTVSPARVASLRWISGGIDRSCSHST